MSSRSRRLSTLSSSFCQGRQVGKAKYVKLVKQVALDILDVLDIVSPLSSGLTSQLHHLVDPFVHQAFV